MYFNDIQQIAMVILLPFLGLLIGFPLGYCHAVDEYKRFYNKPPYNKPPEVPAPPPPPGTHRPEPSDNGGDWC